MSQDPINNFTPRAAQVLALARKEADRLSHNYVGTEHVILGIVKLGQGTAVNVLQKMGIDLETLRCSVEKQLGSGQESKKGGSIPYTPRVKKVLSIAGKEAKTLSHSYLGTEHILLGLLREGEGVAARVMKSLDIDIERMRKEILLELERSLGASSTESETGASSQELGIVHGFAERLIAIFDFNVADLGDPTVAVEMTKKAAIAELRYMRPSEAQHPQIVAAFDRALVAAKSQELVAALAEGYERLLSGNAENHLRKLLADRSPNGSPQRNIGTALQILNGGKPVSFEIDFLRKWEKAS
jgi:ATP-dependent Clp protease ATP-binding subunit ClpA